MKTNSEKYDDEMYKLIDENNLNYCGKKNTKTSNRKILKMQIIKYLN